MVCGVTHRHPAPFSPRQAARGNQRRRETSGPRDGTSGGVAPANFVDWRARSGSFEHLAAVDPFSEFTLVGQGDPERVAGARVSPALFPLLGARMAAGRGFLPGEDLREGRGFTDRDNDEGPAVAIVNEAAARRYWPNENPIGRRLQIDGPPWRTVIGIVANVRHTGLDVEAKPERPGLRVTPHHRDVAPAP